MLDAFSALRDPLRGGGDVSELNERLRAKFAEFRLDQVEDGVVSVVPVLRSSAVRIDATAAWREWHEAGEPEPTAEQVEAADAEERAAYAELRAEDPIWVGAPPPLRALSVPIGEGPDSHELGGFPTIALPALLVEISRR